MSGIHRPNRHHKRKSAGLSRTAENARTNSFKRKRRKLLFESLEERRVLNADWGLSELWDVAERFERLDGMEGESTPAITSTETDPIRFAQRIGMTPTNPWLNPTIRLDV